LGEEPAQRSECDRANRKTYIIGSAHLAKEKDQAEDSPIRYLMAEKYQEWENGRTLSEWARTSLVIEIEFEFASNKLGNRIDVRKASPLPNCSFRLGRHGHA
jgi:hypothetical protein